MKLVEKLKQRFPVEDSEFGRCIVIPFDQFNPDWDLELLNDGYECQAKNNKVYVVLDSEVSVEPLKINLKGKAWSEQDDKYLVELLSRGLSHKEIASTLGRTIQSVRARIQLLRKKGILQPGKKGRPCKTKQPENSQGDQKFSAELSQILTILKDLSVLMDKLDCKILMDALQVKQLKGELAIPSNLWTHYVNALLRDDKSCRDIFRMKVRKLLEASE